MKDSKKIKLNGETYEVRKMPIRSFAQLLTSVENLPSKIKDTFTLEELQNLTNEMFLEKVPSLLSNSFDDIINLTSVASGIDKEVIAELGFDEFIDVITAVLELNNIKAIVDKVKNLGKVIQGQKK
jgi:hypothetical protein